MPTPSDSGLLEILRSLRQTRSYSPGPIADDALDAILGVARWTGSGGNKQPWKLVVVRDRSSIARLASLKADTGWLVDAAVVIGIVSSGKTAESSRFDIGRLVERTMLAATASGLAAAVIGFGPADLEPAQGARQLLKVPDGLWLTHAVVIGQPGPIEPAQGGKPGGRKPLSEILVQEQFSD